MKTSHTSQIALVVNSVRKVSDRVAILRKKGFIVEEKPMGSGGVHSIKNIKGETRYQIGYGHGRYNYAMCVIL